MDAKTLDVMKLLITRIMYSPDAVSFDDVSELAHIFALDYCRRQFAFCLKQIIDQVS